MSWKSSKGPFKYQLSPHERGGPSLSVCVAPLSASAKQASSIISKKEVGLKEGSGIEQEGV